MILGAEAASPAPSGPIPMGKLVDNSPLGKITSYVRGHAPGLLLIAGAALAFLGKRKPGLYTAGAGAALLLWEKRGSWY